MQGRRGFTLIEMMIVVAVISIVGALAVTAFGRWQRHNALRESALAVTGELRRTRALAQSGRTDIQGFGAGDRIVQTGLRRLDGRTYQVFVDRDDQADGNEIILQKIELPVHGFPIESDWSVNEIRFGKNGLLATGNEAQIRCRDTENGEFRTIRVKLGGKAELE